MDTISTSDPVMQNIFLTVEVFWALFGWHRMKQSKAENVIWWLLLVACNLAAMIINITLRLA